MRAAGPGDGVRELGAARRGARGAGVPGEVWTAGGGGGGVVAGLKDGEAG